MDAVPDAGGSEAVHAKDGARFKDFPQPHPLRAPLVRPHVRVVREPSGRLPGRRSGGHVPVAVCAAVRGVERAGRGAGRPPEARRHPQHRSADARRLRAGQLVGRDGALGTR